MLKYPTARIITFLILLLALNGIFIPCLNAQGLEFNVAKHEFETNKDKLPFDVPFSILLTNADNTKEYMIAVFQSEHTRLISCRKNKVENDSLNFTPIFNSDAEKPIDGKLRIAIKQKLQPNRYFIIDVIERGELNEKQKTLAGNALKTEKFKGLIFNLLFKKGNTDNSIQGISKDIYMLLAESGFSNCKISDKSLIDGRAQELISLTLSKYDDVSRSLYECLDSVNFKFDSKINKDTLFKDFKVGQSDSHIINVSNTTVNNYANALKKLVDNWKEKEKEIINKKFSDKKINATDTAKNVKALDSYYTVLLKVVEELRDINRDFENEFDKKFIPEILESLTVTSNLSSTIINEDSNPGPYTSQSFGYGYTPALKNMYSYFTMSIYFTPVNVSVPLSYARGNGRFWLSRIGLNLGASLEEFSNEQSVRTRGLGSFLGNKAGIVGIGIRPFHFLKFDINMLLYKADDPNPLKSTTKVGASMMYGLSINLNLLKLFTGQPNSLTTLTNELKK